MICTRSPLVSAIAAPYQTCCEKHIGFSNREQLLHVSSLATSRTRSLARQFKFFSVSLAGVDDRLRLYDHYSFSVIPLLGTILAGDRASYQYLVESIRRFPGPEEFTAMIKEAGFVVGGDFDGGAWTSLWGGVACIHRAVKL